MHHIFFFLNATASTEIYSSLHTLSLHDALPLSPAGAFEFVKRGADQHRAGAGDRMAECDRAAVGIDLAAVEIEVADELLHHDRSEEHTSELQSLMRISYAVFCLKKKKIKQQTK